MRGTDLSDGTKTLSGIDPGHQLVAAPASILVIEQLFATSVGIPASRNACCSSHWIEGASFGCRIAGRGSGVVTGGGRSRRGAKAASLVNAFNGLG